MIKEAIATGSTVEEAKESAAKELEALGFTDDKRWKSASALTGTKSPSAP